MKFAVELNGQQRELEIKGMSAKVAKRIMGTLTELQQKMKTGEMDGMKLQAEFTITLEKVIMEKTGLTQDELDSLEVADYSKLNAYVYKKAEECLGFLNAS